MITLVSALFQPQTLKVKTLMLEFPSKNQSIPALHSCGQKVSQHSLLKTPEKLWSGGYWAARDQCEVAEDGVGCLNDGLQQEALTCQHRNVFHDDMLKTWCGSVHRVYSRANGYVVCACDSVRHVCCIPLQEEDLNHLWAYGASRGPRATHTHSSTSRPRTPRSIWSAMPTTVWPSVRTKCSHCRATGELTGADRRSSSAKWFSATTNMAEAAHVDHVSNDMMLWCNWGFNQY